MSKTRVFEVHFQVRKKTGEVADRMLFIRASDVADAEQQAKKSFRQLATSTWLRTTSVEQLRHDEG